MSNSNPELKVGGIVLCGGASARMNYPKALLPLGNEVMLQRVVRIVSSCAHPVAVIASPEQELPPLASDVQTAFDREPLSGPLAAIGQGLELLQGNCDAVLVSGCDTPLIQEVVLRRLLTILDTHQLAMVREGDRLHPLAAVYRISLIEPIQHMLSQGKRRLMDLVEQVDSVFLETGELQTLDPGLRSLRNINTRAQYLELLSELDLRDATSLPFADELSD
ncbi:molybdenum cofactor guanylyltransferase [Gimesia panareensis]|uniref:Probable molybdenum cofactor guanylyltransferase n=1 Tax=Gimesia panareensis TaxID=2527978 RepID=A0A518A9X9_9PLAN|nr:molybdenum cofactor guanylyltransferase [Gimesia panareensis]QDU51532.1 molybdopterin-guanine dinucleotide biosynthesis protein MobA [Gimesia panareensis]QDV19421.1 molybdopterin-guanine dinucleotide biosynthesis protein MobA [Gimesia panareensis]